MSDTDMLGNIGDLEWLAPEEDLGDVEAEDAPPPAAEAAYIDDPDYDTANDELFSELYGEDDEEGTPGASEPDHDGALT